MKPVSKTAYYCCGVRMVDAERKRPFCGDTYAKLFMDGEGMAVFAPFARETRSIRGNAARHRIIDDWLRDALRAHPEVQVITIGAGFDTRPYRITGGRWLELDEEPVIALKEQRLPHATCKNPLERLSVDFASERLIDKLRPYQTDGFCIIVLEGVLMYLPPEAIGQTLSALRELFPRHELVCDLMRRAFLDKHSKGVRDRVERLGAKFCVGDDPEGPFIAQGYRRIAHTSVVERSLQLSLPSLLCGLTALLPRDLIEGYWVGVYRPDLAAARNL
jgi:methyltransferase (TIGR00027 family)